MVLCHDCCNTPKGKDFEEVAGIFRVVFNAIFRGGGEEYVMPEVPPEPEQLPSSCDWTQTNSNAYLLSDGNQYFDTKVPINSKNNISVTMQVANGANARIFGTLNATCKYDMTLNQNSKLGVSMSTNGSTTYPLVDAQPNGKNTYSTQTASTATTYTNKYIYVNGTKLSNISKKVTNCTGTNTMLVLNNDYITGVNPALSDGIKLYNIKLYNSSGTMIHNYQPVAAGTDICGYTVPTNAMWDTVSKQVYLPAGTGQMGYGVDPAE